MEDGMMKQFILSVFALACLLAGSVSALQFGHTYSNHMVLQRAPSRAMLYGYADVIGDTVTVTLSGTQMGSATVQQSTENSSHVGYWEMLLPVQSRHGPFVLTASCADGNVTLVDVMFGDVWVCSGQSNMFFMMNQVNNSAQEIQDALAYTDVRIMLSKLVASDTEQHEAEIRIPWNRPRKNIVDYFSAVCFMFGRNLQSHLNVPIGLIETSWGGTKIEPWSSPDALAACQDTHGRRAVDQGTPSALWNAMVEPFLKTTIKGAIWYQGESNGPQGYDCMFPEMIKDWRHKFSAATHGQTNPDFPFGFVQLGAFKNLTAGFGFTGTRWAQTANYGYAPNPKMPNTFMAVAADLPDFDSPHGAVHPRYKQDVAARLTLGARVVAYGEPGVVFQAPFPTAYRLDTARHSLDITFDKGAAQLIFHNNTSPSGFELCCDVSAKPGCPNHNWHYTRATSHTQSGITIRAECAHAGHQPTGIRYLWRISPCAFKMCPLYGTTNNLPVPPFIKTGGFGTGSSIVG